MSEFKFLAKTFYGLEEVLASELKDLGVEDIAVKNRAVEFRGSLSQMYIANFCCSTALNILLELSTFRAVRANQLYDRVREIEWPNWFDVKRTIAVEAVTFSEEFHHSKFVALKVKDAICDKFRDKVGSRPDIDPIDPDVKITVHISQQNQVTISLNSSGAPLFKRGYRTRTNKAPINEVLAAGIIRLIGWRPEQQLIDPMCGSGTFLMEGAMLANRIPSGFFRDKFCFESWEIFDESLWQMQKQRAIGKITRNPIKINGYDISGRTITIAKQNIPPTDFFDPIRFTKMDIADLRPKEKGGVVIMNPPYGERISPEDIKELYEKIGTALKHNFSGFEAWIISSNFDAFKNIGLRPERKIKLYNGALECSLRKYTLYDGSKKTKKQPK